MSGQLLTIHEHTFELLPQKAIYWQDAQTLIVADVHLGKASHFRKNGMAIPLESGMEDLLQLDFLLNLYKPKRLLILGDLFHSDYNQEWEYFGALRKKYADIIFELVRGNHDILKSHQYEKFDITLHEKTLSQDNFIFAHDFVITPSWYILASNPLRMKPMQLAKTLLGARSIEGDLRGVGNQCFQRHGGRLPDQAGPDGVPGDACPRRGHRTLGRRQARAVAGFSRP